MAAASLTLAADYSIGGPALARPNCDPDYVLNRLPAGDKSAINSMRNTWLGNEYDKDHYSIFALIMSRAAHNSDALKELDIPGKDDGFTILGKAALVGWERIVKVLVDHNINVNAKDSHGCTALDYASAENNTEIISLLRQAGARYSTDIKEPLRNAGTRYQQALAFPFLQGFSKGQWLSDRLFQRFLKLKVEDYEKDDLFTALLMSTRWGNTDKAKLIINSGFDVNTTEADGVTALHIAALFGRVEIANLLIRNGADVNAKDKLGSFALGQASMGITEGHTETVKLLIRNSADINAKTTNGITALIATSIFGNLKVAKLLVKNGADVNAKATVNGETVTALSLASENGHTEIVNLLKQAGAIQ